MSLEKVTAESVRRGHPDKMSDQIADAVLRSILMHAPPLEKNQLKTRVACEVGFFDGKSGYIGGEISTGAKYDPIQIARDIMRDIGWIDEAMGLKWDKVNMLITIKPQSPDIAQGVDRGKGAYKATPKIGAGDQGIMIGYATRETQELMPAPIVYAHQLVRKADDLMKSGDLPFLWPDGKAQITLVRDRKTYKPIRADSVVVSVQHNPSVEYDLLRQAVETLIIKPTLADLIDKDTKIFVNPTGRFVIGGPQSDTGFTGRKIVVDAYGPEIQVGGGAFSGKDPTKVDRSAAYAARHIAKNIVAAELADRCVVRVSYVIGVAEPTEVTVDTLGTGKFDGKYVGSRKLIEFEKILGKAVMEIFPLEPSKIISRFNLMNFDYRTVSCYGHFGRLGLPWERTDKVNQIIQAVRQYYKG